MSLGPRALRIFLLAIATVVATLPPVRPLDAQDKSLEYRVKAAMVCKLASVTEWSSSAFASDNAPYKIGILGTDPFGSAIETAVKGKAVRGRGFSVIRSSKIADLLGCQIVFVSDSEKGRLESILAAVRETDILTISDIGNFAEQGGLLGFTVIRNRVRLKLNQRRRLELKDRVKLRSQFIRICIPVNEVESEQD